MEIDWLKAFYLIPKLKSHIKLSKFIKLVRCHLSFRPYYRCRSDFTKKLTKKASFNCNLTPRDEIRENVASILGSIPRSKFSIHKNCIFPFKHMVIILRSNRFGIQFGSYVVIPKRGLGSGKFTLIYISYERLYPIQGTILFFWFLSLSRIIKCDVHVVC